MLIAGQIVVVPLACQEVSAQLIAKAHFDDARGIAAHDGIGWDVVGDHGQGGENSAGADANGARRGDGDVIADPDIMADGNRVVGRELIGQAMAVGPAPQKRVTLIAEIN